MAMKKKPKMHRMPDGTMMKGAKHPTKKKSSKKKMIKKSYGY